MKNPPAERGDTGDVGSVPGSEDALEEGTHRPAFLPESAMDQGAQGHSPWDDKESDVTGRLSTLWHVEY